MIQRQIEVALGERTYPVYSGTDMVSSFAPMCRQHDVSDSLVLISDRNVASLHLQPLLRNLVHYKFQPRTIVLPPGETQKNIYRANSIFTELLKKKVPRNSTVIALGGGVVGDLAGFVAATYQRGIALIQVPTTLLAQVDSSIGGKVGVNHPLGKNMIGAFHQPVFVWADTDYLATLKPREVICGFGEVFKYGLIKDARLFEFMESHLEKILSLEQDAILHVQARCAAIKAEVVAQDEKEAGIRIILNCGHTIGHGLEFAGHYTLLKHGEAVLLGMAAESSIAHEMNLLDSDSYRRIMALLRRIPVKAKLKKLAVSDVLNALGRDKKRVGTKLRFVLPVGIGKVKVVDDVNTALIQKAVKNLMKD
ncbi:MAG: 3-dehydroquinate synthase [Ignavibacteriae bacterium]|nr:MAG: 3-dehydroquinate synthase [Ignavibacteriota bacterium]